MTEGTPQSPSKAAEEEFAKAEAAIMAEMEACPKLTTPQSSSPAKSSRADSPKRRTPLKRPGAKAPPKGKGKAKAKSSPKKKKSETPSLKRPAAKTEESGGGEPAPSEKEGKGKKAGKSKAREADEERARKLLDAQDEQEAAAPEDESGPAADGQVEKVKRDPQKAWYFHKHLGKLPEQAITQRSCPLPF